MKLDQLQTEELYLGITQGDTALLSRAITLLESQKPTHRAQAEALLQRCLPDAGHSLRIGITGVPGAGKSTFIEQVGQRALQDGMRLAILAVDPSSRKTGGSILGDKTRMEQLSQKPEVFIRPTPAGDALGGVANSTRESIILLEAAGYNLVLIETVGVGQSEVAVHSMTDIFLLLLISGAGDELQGIKRGIMEMADIVVVNKADGDNVERARNTKLDFARALHLFSADPSGWAVPVDTCSSITGEGIDRVWKHVLDCRNHFTQSGLLQKKRQQQQLDWFHASLRTQLQSWLQNQHSAALAKAEQEVIHGEQLPSIAVAKLLQSLQSAS